ncbi:MAG: hypothetical protein V9H25_13855 [Candidatus Competibacter sp.]
MAAIPRARRRQDAPLVALALSVAHRISVWLRTIFSSFSLLLSRFVADRDASPPCRFID